MSDTLKAVVFWARSWHFWVGTFGIFGGAIQNTTADEVVRNVKLSISESPEIGASECQMATLGKTKCQEILGLSRGSKAVVFPASGILAFYYLSSIIEEEEIDRYVYGYVETCRLTKKMPKTTTRGKCTYVHEW